MSLIFVGYSCTVLFLSFTSASADAPVRRAGRHNEIAVSASERPVRRATYTDEYADKQATAASTCSTSVKLVGNTAGKVIPDASITKFDTNVMAAATDRCRIDGDGYCCFHESYKGDTAWFEWDLQSSKDLAKIQTGGRSYGNMGVSSYKILYSMDGDNWATYQENDTDKIFSGNDDGTTLVNNSFLETIVALKVRLVPVACTVPTQGTRSCCLRAEIYGCDPVAVPDIMTCDGVAQVPDTHNNFNQPFNLSFDLITDPSFDQQSSTGGGGIIGWRNVNEGTQLGLVWRTVTTHGTYLYATAVNKNGQFLTTGSFGQQTFNGKFGVTRGTTYNIKLSWDGAEFVWKVDGTEMVRASSTTGFGNHERGTACWGIGGGAEGWSGQIINLNLTDSCADCTGRDRASEEDNGASWCYRKSGTVRKAIDGATCDQFWFQNKGGTVQRPCIAVLNKKQKIACRKGPRKCCTGTAVDSSR